MTPPETDEDKGHGHMTDTAAERPAGSPTGYRINFPKSWWHFDLDPSTRDASIRRRVEKVAAGRDDIDREQLDSLVRELRRTTREAHARGALQAAGMLAFLTDGSTMTATTVVLRTEIPEGEPADLYPLMVSAGVHNNRASVGRGTGANTVEIMEVPELGSVGRMTSVEDVDYAGRATVRTGMHHVVVPVPGSRTLLIISSSTPNITMLDEFFEVFDAIAGTFRFRDGAGPEGVDIENGK
jgi:hypothetical protein